MTLSVPFYAAINLQKATTLFFIIGCMFYYSNFTATAYVYAALHGSYGYCWLLKEAVFPNKNLRIPSTRLGLLGLISSALLLYLPGYWTIPILAISNTEEASPSLLGVAVATYVMGVVMMMVSDCQTYWILKMRPNQLIDEGMNAYVRHPNYTGELMLYSSFCMLARHWAAWLVLCVAFLVALLPLNLRKEKSLSRYPTWPKYYARTGMYLPYLPSVLTGARDDAVSDPKKT